MSIRRLLQIALLVLGALAISACKVITIGDVSATQTARAKAIDVAVATAVAATLASQPTQDVNATVQAAIATAVTDLPTPTSTLPLTSTVAFISCHGLYATSMADGTLQQQQTLDDCGRFTLQRLGDGKVALKTCHDQYVTASMTATTYFDWVVTQSPDLSDCGRFTLHDLGDSRVAFGTCAGRYVTAVNDKGEPEVAWYVIAHTYKLDAWETFMMVQP